MTDQKANGMSQKPTRSRIGRPPAGLRAGEMVKNYPQVSLRLPPETRSKLTALSAVCGIPQWRIIVDAVNNYVRDQSFEARQSIQQMADGKAGRSAQRRVDALRPPGAANRKRGPES